MSRQSSAYSQWYVPELEAVRDQIIDAGPDSFLERLYLDISEDGVVSFGTKLTLPLDVIVESDRGSERYDEPYESFLKIRRKLGLAACNDEYPWLSEMGSMYLSSSNGLSLGILSRKLSNAEAMFIIALPLATPERPLETVLREIRECGRVGLGGKVELTTASQREQELIAKHRFRQHFFELVQANPFHTLREVADTVYDNTAARRFVEEFARYKHIIEGLPTLSKEDRQQAFKQLATIESKLPELQLTALASMKLGDRKTGQSDSDEAYRSIDAVNIADYMVCAALLTYPEDPHYVPRFEYAPVTDIRTRTLSAAQKASLKLVILPAGYMEQRSRAKESSQKKDWLKNRGYLH